MRWNTWKNLQSTSWTDFPYMVSALPPDVRLASVLLDQLLLPPLHHHPLNHHPFKDQHRLQDPVEVHFHNCIELSASRPVQLEFSFISCWSHRNQYAHRMDIHEGRQNDDLLMESFISGNILLIPSIIWFRCSGGAMWEVFGFLLLDLVTAP